MGKASKKKGIQAKLDREKRSLYPDESTSFFFTGRYVPLIAFVLISILTLLIYSNTFNSSFQFDGVYHIEENPKIRDLANFWPPSGSRYIGFLSFALNYYFGGLDLFGFHLINTFIHIVNGFLVWWLVTLTFRTPSMQDSEGYGRLKYFLPLFTALVFVAHPVQTQAVTYIVQRFTSLATLFYILSVVLYVKARLLSLNDKGRGLKPWLFTAGAFISALLAMKTKEIAFTLPFLLLLYEFVFFRGKEGERFKLGDLRYLVPILITLIVIPISIIDTDRPLGDMIGEIREASQETEEIFRGVYFLTQLRVIVTYIRLLFLPVYQNLDYDYPLAQSFFEPGVLLSFLFLLAIFCFAVYLLLRSKKSGNASGLLISFGILWFFLTLSVESSVIPIKDVIFEHRLYLPSIGFIIAIGSSIMYGIERLGKRSLQKFSFFKIAVIAVAVVVIPLSIAAYKRNYVWENKITLWEDVVKKSPGKARAHYNLGTNYGESELLDKAENELKKTLKIDPGKVQAHYNLALAYQKKGLLAEAMDEYKTSLALKPSFTDAYVNLGVVLGKLGKKNEAIQEYYKALQVEPHHVEALYNLGNALYDTGSIDEAVMRYRQALSYDPDNVDVRNNLGAAYYMRRDIDLAITEYKEVVRLKPGHAEAHYNLGLAYRRKGFTKEAIREFETALNINPNYKEARKALGSLIR